MFWVRMLGFPLSSNMFFQRTKGPKPNVTYHLCHQNSGVYPFLYQDRHCLHVSGLFRSPKFLQNRRFWLLVGKPGFTPPTKGARDCTVVIFFKSHINLSSYADIKQTYFQLMNVTQLATRCCANMSQSSTLYSICDD